MKNCQKCGEVLPFSSFPKLKDSKDGYGRWCSKCASFNNIKRTYGISKEEYESLLLKQGSSCAICGVPQSEIENKRLKYFKLCVDHCHSTGKVRGLLCPNCNVMLGHANDNIDKLEAAIRYLSKE